MQCDLQNSLKRWLIGGAILPEVISKEQSTFVPGRLITYNIITAYEHLHSTWRRREPKRTCFVLLSCICRRLMIDWSGIIFRELWPSWVFIVDGGDYKNDKITFRSQCCWIDKNWKLPNWQGHSSMRLSDISLSLLVSNRGPFMPFKF
jgi:hypothetical protein